MVYALVGGDERSVLLGRMLTESGHDVNCFALEKLVRCTSTLEECIQTAQCVVTGVPSITNGLLNAPLSEMKLAAEKVFSLLTPAQVLCGGFGSSEVQTEAEVFDLLKSESFALGNAALTAEGAISLLIEKDTGALNCSEILILGSGRMAKALSKRLAGFDASVTVGARADASLEKALRELRRFDYIVNTVPARIIRDVVLRTSKRGAVIMELASAPGGFDIEVAENAGLTVISAPGLPGKFSPRASAELIEKEIAKFMEGRI